MAFSEGWLRARGQIAFTLALVFSTGLIIYLEALDVEEQIRAKVMADLATSSTQAALVDNDDAGPARTLAAARQAFAAAPDEPLRQASMLWALAMAAESGALDRTAAASEAQDILKRVATLPVPQRSALAPALTAIANSAPATQPQVAQLLAAPAEA